MLTPSRENASPRVHHHGGSHYRSCRDGAGAVRLNGRPHCLPFARHEIRKYREVLHAVLGIDLKGARPRQRSRALRRRNIAGNAVINAVFDAGYCLPHAEEVVVL